MDSEAAVIKSEMMRTRANLDRKIAAARDAAQELTPRRYAQRHLPEHALDRAVGGILTLVGLRHGLETFRNARTPRAASRPGGSYELVDSTPAPSFRSACFGCQNGPRELGRRQTVRGWELTMISAE